MPTPMGRAGTPRQSEPREEVRSRSDGRPIGSASREKVFRIVGLKPSNSALVIRANRREANPEPVTVIEDLSVHQLVKDYVINHGSWGRHQPPIERHILLRRTRPPSGLLRANKTAVVPESMLFRKSTYTRLKIIGGESSQAA